MRTIPEAMALSLRQGAAKLCHVWRIERADGEVLSFSNHDRPLVFMGRETRPEVAMTRGVMEAEAGIGGSSQAVAGVITSEGFTGEDIRAGLYDGAGVRLYVVDWTDTDVFVEIGAGRIGRMEITAGGVDRFVAHIEGLSARLGRVIGRRFSRTCDAVLGDARCGLSGALPSSVCDKTYGTCRDGFGNVLNFRGFPDFPGEDVLGLYPRSGDVMDGGARRVRG